MNLLYLFFFLQQFNLWRLYITWYIMNIIYLSLHKRSKFKKDSMPIFFWVIYGSNFYLLTTLFYDNISLGALKNREEAGLEIIKKIQKRFICASIFILCRSLIFIYIFWRSINLYFRIIISHNLFPAILKTYVPLSI